MKFQTILIALVALFTVISCKKEDDPIVPVVPATAELTITFKALYDGLPLQTNKSYDYDTYKVQFSQFNTYLSDIKLLNGTTETLLAESAFINFTPSAAADDKSVEVTLKVTVPTGDYTGIKMGYGVKPSLNAKRPSDFPAGHPLAQEVEYWPGWKSYIFNKIEGQGDSNNDQVDDIFMIFHCGSDKVYREASFAQNMSIKGNANLSVEFDLKKVFYADNAWWDLTQDKNAFTSNLATDTRVAAVLMDNFDNATTIKF
jgi:hypothetical protein